MNGVMCIMPMSFWEIVGHDTMKQENHKNLHEKLSALKDACAPTLWDRRLYFVMATISLLGRMCYTFAAEPIEAIFCDLISLMWISAYFVRGAEA